MGYVEQTLLPGEEVAFRAKLSKWIFMRPVVGLTACGILMIVFFWSATVSNADAGGAICGTLFLFGCFVYGLMALVAFLNFSGAEFAVTNKRVLVKHGVIRRVAVELQLVKVESSSIRQGIMGRILGFGTVVVSGSGGTHNLVPNISSPVEFKRAVQEQADKLHTR